MDKKKMRECYVLCKRVDFHFPFKTIKASEIAKSKNQSKIEEQGKSKRNSRNLFLRAEESEKTICASTINEELTKENGKLNKNKIEIKYNVKCMKRRPARERTRKTQFISNSDKSQTEKLESNFLNNTFPPFTQLNRRPENKNPAQPSATLNKTAPSSPSSSLRDKDHENIFKYFLTPQKCRLTKQELDELKRKRLTPLLRSMKRKRLQSTELMTFKKLRSGSIISEMQNRKCKNRNVPSTGRNSSDNVNNSIEQLENRKSASDCNENSLAINYIANVACNKVNLMPEMSTPEMQMLTKNLNIEEKTVERIENAVNGHSDIEENVKQTDELIVTSNQLENETKDNTLPNQLENETKDSQLPNQSQEHDLSSTNEYEVPLENSIEKENKDICVDKIELNSNNNKDNGHEMIVLENEIILQPNLKDNINSRCPSEDRTINYSLTEAKSTEFGQIVNLECETFNKLDDVIARDINEDLILDSSLFVTSVDLNQLIPKLDADDFVSKDSNKDVPLDSSLLIENLSTDSNPRKSITSNERSKLTDNDTIVNENPDCSLLNENVPKNVVLPLDGEDFNQLDDLITKGSEQGEMLDLQLEDGSKELDASNSKQTNEPEATDCLFVDEAMSVGQITQNLDNECKELFSKNTNVVNNFNSPLSVEDICIDQSPIIQNLDWKSLIACSEIVGNNTCEVATLISEPLAKNICKDLNQILPKLIVDVSDDLPSNGTNEDKALACLAENNPIVLDQIASTLDSETFNKLRDLISNNENGDTILDSSQSILCYESSNQFNTNPIENVSTDLNKTDDQQSELIDIEHDLKCPSMSFSDVKRKSKNSLKKLASDLSPKLTKVPTYTAGKLSRYGRLQRYKEQIDFIPSNLLYSTRRTKSSPMTTTKPVTPERLNPNLRMTPPSHHLSKIDYVSPIDKLINKNKMLSLQYSPKNQNQNDIEDPEEFLDRCIEHELPLVVKVLDFDNVPEPSLDLENITETNDAMIKLSSDHDNLEVFEDICKPVQLLDTTVEPEILKLLDPIPCTNDANSIVEDNSDLHSCISIFSDSAKGSSIDIDMEQDWKCGHMLWARIGSYPFWPCMVYPDESGVCCVPNAKSGKIHVRFFADKGRRSWILISKSSIMEYKGVDDYLAKKNELSVNFKRHSKWKAFTVNKSQTQAWNEAVIEATTIYDFPVSERKVAFDEVLKIQSTRTMPKPPLKRLSMESFDSMLASTDQLLSSTLSQPASANMSRSISPESPPYEELATFKTDISQLHNEEANKNNRLHDYLLSLPSTSNQSTFDITNDKLKMEEISNISDATAIPVKDEDKEFEIFFREFGFLSKYDEKIAGKNRFLAHEIWMNIRDSKKQQDELKRRSKRDKLRKLPYQFSNEKNGEISQSSTNNIDSDKTAALKTAELKSALKAQMRAARDLKENEEISKYIMKEKPKNLLFKGLKREYVCKICLQATDTVKCSGHCGFYIHKNCGTILSANESNKVSKQPKKKSQLQVTGEGLIENPEEIDLNQDETTINLDLVAVKCPDCVQYTKPNCAVCKSTADDQPELLKCTEKSCSLYYHVECLKYFPQYKLTYSTIKQHLLCPRHACHTCASDDPRGKHFQINNKNLIRCIKCPATYHIDSCCIPAGTELLTMLQLICPKHQVQIKKQINVNWCFICAEGGVLSCCETCPTAFHESCLNMSLPDKYICEECETGRMPLYGEIVWAKCGNWRWWPAIIVPPTEIREQQQCAPHRKHDFCVRFFGSNDFSWLSRGFVFLYQEDDSEFVSNDSNDRKNGLFQRSLERAKYWFSLINQINLKHDNTSKDKELKPQPYKKLKMNRPVFPVKLNELDETYPVCDCKYSDPEPCAPLSNCLNRLSLTECSPNLCAAKEKCQNQYFQKRLYANVLEQRVENRGWGLIALNDIKRGDFVIEYIGELINNAEFANRIRQKQQVKDENFYFLTVTNDLVIDAGPMGNLARFINHSCEPNCETQKWQVNGSMRVGLFAICDIPANTELTFNYFFEYTGGVRKPCYCGAEKCSGFMGAKYVEQNSEPTKKTSKKKNNRSIKDTSANKKSSNGAIKRTKTDIRPKQNSNSIQIDTTKPSELNNSLTAKKKTKAGKRKLNSLQKLKNIEIKTEPSSFDENDLQVSTIDVDLSTECTIDDTTKPSELNNQSMTEKSKNARKRKLNSLQKLKNIEIKTEPSSFDENDLQVSTIDVDLSIECTIDDTTKPSELNNQSTTEKSKNARKCKLNSMQKLKNIEIKTEPSSFDENDLQVSTIDLDSPTECTINDKTKPSELNNRSTTEKNQNARKHEPNSMQKLKNIEIKAKPSSFNEKDLQVSTIDVAISTECTIDDTTKPSELNNHSTKENNRNARKRKLNLVKKLKNIEIKAVPSSFNEHDLQVLTIDLCTKDDTTQPPELSNHSTKEKSKNARKRKQNSMKQLENIEIKTEPSSFNEKDLQVSTIDLDSSTNCTIKIEIDDDEPLAKRLKLAKGKTSDRIKQRKVAIERSTTKK